MRISKGTLAFRIIYFTLLVLIIAAIGIGLLIFRDFLTDYEASQPERIIDSFLWELESGNNTRIMNAAKFTPNSFEESEAFEAAIESTLAGDYSCVKSSKESGNGMLVYAVKSKGEKIGTLTLSEAGETSKYGLTLYEIHDITVNDVETQEITVSAPNTAKVFVNGIELDESYITEKSEIVDGMEYFHQYLDEADAPYMVTYTIDGFVNAPAVSAVDFSGRQLTDTGNNVFEFASEDNEELKTLGKDFSLAYSRYIANDGSLAAVDEFLADDLELYEALYYYENEFYAWHSDYDFENIVVGEPVFYTENCFTIDISYDHIIYSTEIFTFKADNTAYFVNIDGSWKATDIVMN